MTIRWYDGFEHYGDDETLMLEAGWASGAPVIQSTVKATGTYAIRMPTLGGIRRITLFDAAQTIGGCALRLHMQNLPDTTGPWNVMQFRNSANRAHISIQVDPVGRIVVVRGGEDALSADGTEIGTSVRAMQVGAFNHIECKVKIHATEGYVKVRVNGQDEDNGWINLEDIDTEGAFSGDEFISILAFGQFDSSEADPWGASNNNRPFLDDIVCWDAEISDNHDGDFIGLHGVYYQPADADGTYEVWQLSTGTDTFALVDEVEPDEDTTYIFSDAAAQKSSVNVADLPANVSEIKCVAALARARKTDSGTCDISLGVRTTGGTEDYGDDGSFPITDSYYTYQTLFEINPQTAAPWTTGALPQVLVERDA